MNQYNEEKDKEIIKEILALEKINNRSQLYSNQEMINKISEIIKKGVSHEV